MVAQSPEPMAHVKNARQFTGEDVATSGCSIVCECRVRVFIFHVLLFLSVFVAGVDVAFRGNR